MDVVQLMIRNFRFSVSQFLVSQIIAHYIIYCRRVSDPVHIRQLRFVLFYLCTVNVIMQFLSLCKLYIESGVQILSGAFQFFNVLISMYTSTFVNLLLKESRGHSLVIQGLQKLQVSFYLLPWTFIMHALTTAPM